jgi:hypothetical protein
MIHVHVHVHVLVLVLVLVRRGRLASNPYNQVAG